MSEHTFRKAALFFPPSIVSIGLDIFIGISIINLRAIKILIIRKKSFSPEKIFCQN